MKTYCSHPVCTVFTCVLHLYLTSDNHWASLLCLLKMHCVTNFGYANGLLRVLKMQFYNYEGSNYAEFNHVKGWKETRNDISTLKYPAAVTRLCYIVTDHIIAQGLKGTAVDNRIP